MSKQVKVAIGVISAVLAGLVIWIIWLATNDGAEQTTPAPIPSVTPSVSESEEPTTPTASPETTPSHSPEDSPSAEPTQPQPTTPTPSETAEPDAPQQSFLGAGLATFEHFSVEVLPYDPDTAPEVIEDKIGFEVEVCVLQGLGDQTRISTEPWTLVASNGDSRQPVTGAYDPVFPPEGSYSEGECVRGWITFDEFDVEELDWANLTYANGLGDQAVWNFH